MIDLQYLFENFKESAFRLEALPIYNVDSETDAFNYFKAAGKVPDGHNSDWAELIRRNVAAGKTMKRLRLFTVPLNDYEKFERLAYEANIDAGEQIHATNNVGYEHTQDFWTFDDKWIAWMIYDETGAWNGANVSEMNENDREMVNRWIDVWGSVPPVREAVPVVEGHVAS